jgi:PIN domain nuclease of toxin-antitoxin system
MKLLLDTCCIIWAIAEPAAISEDALALLSTSRSLRPTKKFFPIRM